MIEFKQVGLSFPQQKICENLSFSIHTNEFACIHGASGTGKTSLLKMLMGFLVPQSGSIRVNGLDVNATTVHEIRKQISWLPQNVNLPVHSGKELVELLQLDSSAVRAYHSYLDQLGLSAQISERYFSEISGGQKQRIVLAACLSLEKPIVLLDEPVSALDEKSIDLLIEAVQSIKNRTIVSTSHNLKWLQHCTKQIAL